MTSRLNGRACSGWDAEMSAGSERTLNWIAAWGLLVGAAFGLAGTLVRSPDVQASLWAIDSVGLVIATSLLALKYFRAGADIIAGGFLVFAIGEGVLLSGTAAGPSGSPRSPPGRRCGQRPWPSSARRGSCRLGRGFWGLLRLACSPSRQLASTPARYCCPPRRHSRF